MMQDGLSKVLKDSTDEDNRDKLDNEKAAEVCKSIVLCKYIIYIIFIIALKTCMIQQEISKLQKVSTEEDNRGKAEV